MTTRDHFSPSPHSTPVITVCSLTPAQRSLAAGGLLVDLDHGIQLSYDIGADEDMLRRTVHDRRQVMDEATVPMSYECLTCSLREQIAESVSSWAGLRRPIVLALPPTVEPANILPALMTTQGRSGRIRVAQVMSVIDADTFEADLFGDDLLDDRDLACGRTDRRAVGETIAHHIEFADVVAYDTIATERVSAILDHLLDPVARHAELHRVDGTALLAARASTEPVTVDSPCGSLEQPRRGNPAYAKPTGATEREGIWTIDLYSERPFSPRRLQDEIAELGGGRIRGRGEFWVATRPDLRCAWDGAGGQLSIGPVGPWSDRRPRTHLVITGCGDRDPDLIRAAFHRALLSDEEDRAGIPLWDDDGLDPWLGTRTSTC